MTPRETLAAHRDAVDPVAPPRAVNPAIVAAELAATRRLLAEAIQRQRDGQVLIVVAGLSGLMVGVAIGAQWLAGGAS
jgi:hypothetical protein